MCMYMYMRCVYGVGPLGLGGPGSLPLLPPSRVGPGREVLTFKQDRMKELMKHGTILTNYLSEARTWDLTVT
jgi:hypothetical protein